MTDEIKCAVHEDYEPGSNEYFRICDNCYKDLPDYLKSSLIPHVGDEE